MTFSSSLDCLHEMLTYCRPHGSRAEEDFIQRYIRPLGMATDSAGNLHKRIGETDILWSCHTDTVHRKDGAQAIEVTSDGWVFAKDSDCLGGDCTAGVWLMVNMIQRHVPGWYVFHRAEEVGGLGSTYIAKKKREAVGQGQGCHRL
jgi:acetylornithine deacetylase/succinyl-diaminopimelate desuccinylase-like protein